MSCTITFSIESLSHIPFDNYQKDFTFIVNNEKFSINIIIADILSPKISKIHLTDPTINQYSITTKSKGDFRIILDLITSKCKEIPENQIPFISEIIQNLELKVKIRSNKENKITVENVIDLLYIHEQMPQFYSELIDKEIEFVSENFYTIEKNQKEKFIALSNDTIEIILNHPKLRLENENQLLNFVNFLYSNNSIHSNLYGFVLFSNVDTSSIDEFISIFNIDHITNKSWIEISKRLRHEILYEKKEEEVEIKSNRYVKKSKTISVPFKNIEFDGIFKYLENNSNNIKDEVNITYSSPTGYSDPFNLLQFDNVDNFFYPNRTKSFNQWICFEFKKHKVIPCNYTIRSEKSNGTGGYHPKSWVIEASNNFINWDTIDTQNNCSYLNGSSLVHTFNMNGQNKKEYKYLRMRLTEPNWRNDELLLLNSIEFYGDII